MLLDDIITLINDSFRNSHVTDNEPIDRRIIQDWVMLQRNLFVKNFFNQNGSFEQNCLQFEILDIEKYDPALSLGGVSLDKFILRTEPCPNLVEGRKGVAVYELTSPDLISKTIQSVSFDRLRWCGNGRVNKNAIFAAFYDGRWYLKSNAEVEKPMRKLHVVGVFADPTLVSTYKRNIDDYPVNDYMIKYMITEVQTKDFAFTSQTKSDKTNDSSGEVSTQNQNN
jgi:hypothetical protein